MSAVGAGSSPAALQESASSLGGDVQLGVRLYRRFSGFAASELVKTRQPRIIPPVVVELGELLGLIYRSDKRRSGQPQAYIHLMEDPPRLVTNVQGTQLYLVGGRYRVTGRGIEG